MMYLIWSWEHEAWWAPARRGYTADITEAGEYTFAEAAQIVVPHIPPGEEVAVMLTPALREKIDYQPPAYVGSVEINVGRILSHDRDHTAVTGEHSLEEMRALHDGLEEIGPEAAERILRENLDR